MNPELIINLTIYSNYLSIFHKPTVSELQKTTIEIISFVVGLAQNSKPVYSLTYYISRVVSENAVLMLRENIASS